MKWAVIGSNSFSGNAFVEYLQAKYSENVIRIERPNYDLNRDMLAIINAISNADYVVNFAALSMVAQSWEYPEAWVRTNTMSLASLARGLLGSKTLKRFVQISTPEVYGSGGYKLMDESQPMNPSTPYAVSRAAGDMMLSAYHKAYGFPVVTTRTVNVYGVGQQLYRIIPKTILCILKGEKLILDGGGVSSRQFIHINDVAEATYMTALWGNVGDVYHSSIYEHLTIARLVSLICRRMGVAFDDVVTVGPERAGKDNNYHLSSDKLRALTGWSPSVNLGAGLNGVIEWMKRDFETLSKRPSTYIFKE